MTSAFKSRWAEVGCLAVLGKGAMAGASEANSQERGGASDEGEAIGVQLGDDLLATFATAAKLGGPSHGKLAEKASGAASPPAAAPLPSVARRMDDLTAVARTGAPMALRSERERMSAGSRSAERTKLRAVFGDFEAERRSVCIGCAGVNCTANAKSKAFLGDCGASASPEETMAPDALNAGDSGVATSLIDGDFVDLRLGGVGSTHCERGFPGD